MSSAASLTQHDNHVLASLFDPEDAPSSISIDASLPADPNITDIAALSQVQAEEKTIIATIETCLRSKPSPAEKAATLSKAQSDLIALTKDTRYARYAGLYNDLAQLLRLQHGDDILFSSSTTTSSAEEEPTPSVLVALDTCISLLSPTSAKAHVSPQQARTLSSALLQRGAILNAAAKHLGRDPSAVCVVEDMRRWTKVVFEEKASECFFEAGRLGNELGRVLAVNTNPTAKLCGQMVKDAMRREYAGLGDGR